jgi:hypothetical protein
VVETIKWPTCTLYRVLLESEKIMLYKNLVEYYSHVHNCEVGGYMTDKEIKDSDLDGLVVVRSPVLVR